MGAGLGAGDDTGAGEEGLGLEGFVADVGEFFSNGLNPSPAE